MRFLPSTSRRTVAEALLAVAIIAFVVYDLGDHSAKPASSDVVLSFEARERAELSTPTTSSRFDATVDPAISASNTYIVCGDTAFPFNPFTIGNLTNQALIVLLGNGCPPNPNITYTFANNNTVNQPITLKAGSWLSFQNISVPDGVPSGATTGPLTVEASSNIEAKFSPALQLFPKDTVKYNLLFSYGECSTSLSQANYPITGCPNDATLAAVGTYVCGVAYQKVTSGSTTACQIFATVVGPLILISDEYTIQFTKDCAVFTVAMFKAIVAATCNVPAAAIEVTAVACGSQAITFRVRGSTAALIAAAIARILAAAAPGGALYIQLGVTYIGRGRGVPSAYYPQPYCYYYGNNYCPSTTYFVSSSNPALFALLTLLVIPVAIILGILFWCCMQKPVCPCAAPAPVCYFPEPTCMVADPCGCPMMDATPLCGSGAPTVTAPMMMGSTPLPYQPVM